MNEKELLSNATLWFEQKHGCTPKKCGTKFIKVWHKPIPLRKLKTVIFAPTEEIGKAFMQEQNLILRLMGYFGIVPLAFFVFMFTFFYELSQENQETARVIVTIFLALCLGALLFCFFMVRKCKKLEKIHQWNVDIYYPPR